MEIRKFYTLWFHSKRKEAMKEFMSSIKGEQILDIGSGTGIFNVVFRQIGFKKIVAVDFNEKSLQMKDAEEKKVVNVENKLPFKNNHFDVCIASEIIEHLKRRKHLLKEIYRILKEGGYLILTTPNKDSLIAKFDKIIRRFIINGEWCGHDFSHRYVYGFNEIRKIVQEVGFRIKKVETFYIFTVPQ